MVAGPEGPRWWVRPALAAAVVSAVALAIACVPPLRAAASTWSVGAIRDKLIACGPWAWALSALLMVLQAIVSPLPAFMVTIANGYVFGAFWGGVLALLSATLAAQLCFEAARALGRPPLERWLGASVLAWADGFFRRHGTAAVLAARLIPFVPFDPISYAAGLTSTTRPRFVAANLVGQLPATFIYSTLGSRFEDGRLPLEVIAALSAAGLAIVGAMVWSARRGKAAS